MSLHFHGRARNIGTMLLFSVLTVMMGGCGGDDSTSPAPTATTTTNKVLQLDGSGDYVSVPLGDHDFSRFTLECLVKVPGIDDSVHYISIGNGLLLYLGDMGEGSVSTWVSSLDPLDAGDAFTDPNISVNQWHHLAFSYDGTNQYILIDGEIDEVRLWNVFRTKEQIKANMNKVIPNQAGLVGYWNFDDGTAKDGTSYDADGVLMGDAKIVNK